MMNIRRIKSGWGRRIMLLCGGIACVAAGCVNPRIAAERGVEADGGRPGINAPAGSADAIRVETIAEGIRRVTDSDPSLGGGSLELYGFDPARFRFGITATSARLGISAWASALPEAVASVNGGYFMEDGTPAGFLSVGGVRAGRAAFDPDKSAIIDFSDGTVRVVPPSATSSRADLPGFQTALQSYPMLIADGHPAVSEDSGKVARRSFIGTDTEGVVWIGVLADADISLYELAHLLAATGIAWRDAVNLDGGPSTGIFVRGSGGLMLRQTFGGIPNVITVWRREPRLTD